uniref:Auxin-responsive protein n=1 Tax=Leersia perrieri TaxID=77586 RepID=A0A0D9Y1A4_9ORYZ
MNKFRNVLLRKCKSLSRSLSRSSSYSNLRSMSTRELAADAGDVGSGGGSDGAVVFVGSSRRRYVISNKHLSHPLIAALIDGDAPAGAAAAAGGGDVAGGGRKLESCGGGEIERRKTKKPIAVNCEVVLFDHLLWMLDNAVDLRAGDDDDDAMRELAQLYAY